MRRVAVTGIGCVGPAGIGVGPLEEALAAGQPLGSLESVTTVRGRQREMRLARLAAFDREAFIPSRKLRRMSEISQTWVIACLLARADAGLAPAAREAPDGKLQDGKVQDSAGYPPERRGTYLGTGFGCLQPTWEYLVGMVKDGAGMANPFLFSESVANAPAGHSAIELDTRGGSVTFTCGDASAATAVACAARAIRDDRVDMACCGGVELFAVPLLHTLAAIGSFSFVGEGCVSFVLEPLEMARARGARIYAEIRGDATASDPAAAAADWSRNSETFSDTMRRAVTNAARTGSVASETRSVFLHACGAPASDEAERRAATELFPHAATRETTEVTGSFAAAGGFNLAAAILHASRSGPAGGLTLVNASSWGGTVVALALTA